MKSIVLFSSGKIRALWFLNTVERYLGTEAFIILPIETFIQSFVAYDALLSETVQTSYNFINWV